MDPDTQPQPALPSKHHSFSGVVFIVTLPAFAAIVFVIYQNLQLKKQTANIPSLPIKVLQPVDQNQPQFLSQRFNSPDELMAKALGTQYYTNHYQKIDQEEVSGNFVKIGYYYSYAPYLTNFMMVLFFDPETGSVSDKEISTVLFSPQEFKISQVEAEKIARSQNIYECTNYSIKPELYRKHYTGISNRFVWRVSGNTGCPQLTIKNQGVATVVILDVETGEIYAIYKNEPIYGF